MKKLLMLCLLLLQSIVADAAGTMPAQSHQQISKLVATFVQQQTSSLAGKVDYQIEDLDPRISLTPCAKLETFLPGGSQLIGKTSIGVRCAEQNGWQILVPVRIRITLALLVSTRQLPVGHTLQDQDIARQSIEISRPDGYTDANQIIGKVLRYSIAAGQILRDDMLRPPYSVTQGQIVQTMTRGKGFSIRGEGVAMNNASEGQTVQVRVSSGRTVSGAARNGIVEIPP
ncbi:MAG: flagella basal body P-ring formation protein FlgA [Gallionellales bacterium GWA2_59_43]|nr:MAG: flagella basal body P-ring formation protein FlgA [Gallionellales bacterium GWA2_59_43]